MSRREYGIAQQDFDKWTLQPENYDRIFEYIGGVAVEREPQFYASTITSQILFYMGNHIKSAGLDGHLFGARAGYIIAGDRYVPNLSYISRDRIQSLPRENGYLDVPPNLALHMIHSSSSLRDSALRIVNYLHVGTMVLYVYYELPEIQVFMQGQGAVVLSADDVLEGGDALPGFELRVRDIFPDEKG